MVEQDVTGGGGGAPWEGGVLRDESAQAGAAELREYARFAAGVLLEEHPPRPKPGRLGCLSAPSEGLISRQPSARCLEDAREARALRRGALQPGDVRQMLRGIAWSYYVVCSIVVFNSVVFHTTLPQWRDTAHTLLLWLAVLALNGLPMLLIGYASVRTNRRRLARGLAAQDLLRQIYDGADPLAAVRRAAFLRRRSIPARTPGPASAAYLRQTANHLDRCLHPSRPLLRWEDMSRTCGWAIFSAAIAYGIICVASLKPELGITLPALVKQYYYSMPYIVLTGLSCFWIIYCGYLRHYRQIISREHWLLDIHDRYLAEDTAGTSARMNMHAEAGDGV